MFRRLWIDLTCNWFVIGLRCWRKGHDYAWHNIVVAPQHTFVVDFPGQIHSEPTGKRVLHQVSVCRYCGNYRGHSTKEL
jgi:hypothetical protein